MQPARLATGVGPPVLGVGVHERGHSQRLEGGRYGRGEGLRYHILVKPSMRANGTSARKQIVTLAEPNDDNKKVNTATEKWDQTDMAFKKPPAFSSTLITLRAQRCLCSA